MEDYIENTIRAYDDVKTYEDATKEMIPKREIDKLLAFTEHGGLILDAGCAYGRDTEYIKTRGYHVKGIDLSPALIKRAIQLIPDIEFSVKDVRKTGFPDETFEGVWCNATLLHLKEADIDAALIEFNRILKPQGVLAVSFKKGSGTSAFTETFSSNSERFFNYQTKESFQPQLLKNGFEEIESYYINERERYGQEKRDLDWLQSFARKL